MMTEGTFGRREFVKKAAQAFATVAVCEGMPAATVQGETPKESAGTIPVRTLGKTGLRLPILGYGGAALPARWRNPLSYEDRVALVRYAFDRGVRYFDTAGNYMESQAILGEALKDRRRDACLVTKVETTKPEDVPKAVEKSLKELQTDYLDILLIHGSPGLEQMSVEQAMKIHAELVKLRDDCLAKAHQIGMGIVAMKVIGGGWLGRWSGYLVPEFDKQRLAQLPAAAIRHVLQDKRVDLLAIGMHLQGQIDANIKTITGDATYTPQDRALLSDFSAKLYETDTVKKLRIE